MSEKVCGIVGTDETYLRRLMSAMNSNQELMLRTQMFTDVEVLYRYQEEHYLDVLIVDSNVKLKKLDIDTIIYLTEEVSADVDKIYKFQSVNAMIKQIMAISGEKKAVCTDMSIIGIYSPVCDKNKLLTALSVARLYGRNKKTLYVNFEEFSGLTKELPAQSQDLSDVAYMYRDRVELVEQKLSEIVVKGMYFDYVAPVQCPTDISFVSTWQWLEIAKCVAKKGNYEVLVIDAGNLMQNPWQIIQLCNVVYMPKGQDVIIQNKIKAFERYLILIGKEILMQKLCYLDLPGLELSEDTGLIEQLIHSDLYEKVVVAVNERETF